MDTWGVAGLLLVVAWLVLAGLPGSPVKGVNRLILALGVVTVIIGYILLSKGPAGNPLSLTWAPVFLVVGYCVLFPVALLRRQSSGPSEER